jgi:hypothetical protein
MDIVYIMKDAGQANPYHLFYYMIGQLHPLHTDPSRALHYFYAPTDCPLAEQALTNLPKRFIRHLYSEDDVIYKESNINFIKEISRSDEHWIFKYIRSLYSHIWSEFKQVPGKYTYISRRKATCRRILNESEILEPLEALDVQVHCMEDLSFVDQIRLFAESEIITGPHGAAFSFAAFCKEGTLLYEIYRASTEKGHYVDLANECQLQYKRFYEVTVSDEDTKDMTIDKESYIEELSMLIQSRILRAASSVSL